MPSFTAVLRATVRRWSPVLLALGAAAAASAQTTPVSGARVVLSTYQACPFFCNYQFSEDGGVGSVLASDSQTRAPDWSAWGQALLTGPQSVPQLKAFAATPAGSSDTSAVAEAYGVQMFTYHGADTTKQLNVHLSGSGSMVDLDLYVYNGSDFMAAVAVGGIPPWYSPATVVNEMGVGVKASTALTAYEDNGQAFLYTDTLSFDLTDGEQVVLWARLTAESRLGSIADGGSTAVMQFVDATGLTPQLAAAPVPEPEQLWMLLPGLAAVALVARRRRAG